MADIPLQSLFSSTPTDAGLDTTATLFTGPVAISTTLAADLSDVETEVMYVTDATFATSPGYAVVGTELIRFANRYGIDRLENLTRGAIPAAHSLGDPVVLHPVFYIPQAIQDAIINLQTRLIALGG